ncbi:hypothetical protein DMA11_04260 [Marinilabiliaceae bacterium JC017]|nr:hypothetical protein DMA11_04260 [Marinilabiliaceae bacterium JC017]
MFVMKKFLMNKKYWVAYSFTVILLVLIAIKIWTLFFSDHGYVELEAEIKTNEYDIAFGADNAVVTIYMYSSYNCGFCTKFFNDVYPKLKTNFIDGGKVRLVVKPLVLGNNAAVQKATQAAICVNKFGSFEKYHQLLIYEPQVVYTNEFKQLLDDYISDNTEIAECLLDNDDYSYLDGNMRDFKVLGLTGTPTFIIGKRVYKGYLDYNSIDKIINGELKKE